MAMPQERQHYTYADYLKWDESFRCELIDGVCYVDGQVYEPFSNSPAALARPSIKHQRISRNLLSQFHQYLEGKQCEVLPEIEVVIGKRDQDNEKITNVYSPDLSIVCDKDKLNDNQCFGAPDMIVEILSKATMRNDKILKYNAYQDIGVKEYWLVDPTNRSVQVFLLENGIFRPVDLYGEDELVKVNVLDGCFIELSRVFPEEE